MEDKTKKPKATVTRDEIIVDSRDVDREMALAAKRDKKKARGNS